MATSDPCPTRGLDATFSEASLPTGRGNTPHFASPNIEPGAAVTVRVAGYPAYIARTLIIPIEYASLNRRLMYSCKNDLQEALELELLSSHAGP